MFAMHLNAQAHERGVQPGERVMQDTDLKLRSDRLKRRRLHWQLPVFKQSQRGTKANVAEWMLLSAGVFELLEHLTFINGHSLACNDLYPLQQLAPHC